MTTDREAIRVALANRDQAALAVAIARCGNDDEGTRIASEELGGLDEGTRAWWEAPQPGCDGINCGHDHALVGAILKGLLER